MGLALLGVTLSGVVARGESPPIPAPRAANAPGTGAPSPPPSTPSPPPAAAWVERSNAHAQVLLQVIARFHPETAGEYGVMGLDEKIIDLGPGSVARYQKALEEALGELRKRLQAETDPLVRQDLEILVQAAAQDIEESRLDERYFLPYDNVPRLVFGGLHALLDDQIPPERRPAALVRLRRYAGLEPGIKPLVELAMAETRERLATPGLLGPARAELERDLTNGPILIDGMAQLFTKYNITGYAEAHAKLKQQLGAYQDFLRKEVLPRARSDFRLPPEYYAFRLRHVGVDIGPEMLRALAHAAFTQIQGEMQVLAKAVAAQHGLQASDYRDVIRALKKEQLVGETIMSHYRGRLGEIEGIVRREKLVSLPVRPARIRLSSEAETATQPAPHMHPPPLLNNHGEQGEFVLPLNIPAPPGSAAAQLKYDDFTYAAASWSLTVHEARPGHEMQFAAMIERGVSVARAIFAFNSVNVEGWGLYSEYLIKPFMPPDGQLISLQFRLQRAARAFLDPELQAGLITPAQAKAVLLNDVVLSEAMATQEVERYTFRAPGQATSYFYGYTKLLGLREEVQKALGPKFDARAFHDFILGQGLLPPALLRKAVLARFMPPAAAAPRK
ncbi:MAG TPA: DUF885 domain-containing protein [Polyangia bacterium]|nr:DUF885 domain-containing protein [Polyangia bacterium]